MSKFKKVGGGMHFSYWDIDQNFFGKYVKLIDDNGKVWHGKLIGCTPAIDNETDGKAMWSVDLDVGIPGISYSFFEDEIISLELDAVKNRRL